MKRAAGIFSVAMLWTCSFASYAAEDRPIIAVFDIEARDVNLPANKINNLTDYLCSLLAEKGFQVVPREKLRESLAENKKESYKECFNQACQIEIGQELAAQKSLSTQVIALGGSCKVTITLYDLKKATSEAGRTASGKCDEADIVKSLEQVVGDLVGGTANPLPKSQPGKATVPPPETTDYEKMAGEAEAAEEAKRVERGNYRAALEKAWAAVQKIAESESIARKARAATVRKFLADFVQDNSHADEAKMIADALERESSPIVWVESRPAGIEFSKTEVTVGQYRACVEAGKCTGPRSKTDSKHCNWGQGDRDEHPVNCVDWNQATAFCGWVGGRLPTENEWYAEASNGGSRKYPWGDAEVTCDYAIMSQDSLPRSGCGKDSTWPACSKERGNSVSGLCDMSGNLWEWTSKADGSGPVLRGGSWYDRYPFLMLASNRSGYDLQNSYFFYGFRCGRSAKP